MTGSASAQCLTSSIGLSICEPDTDTGHPTSVLELARVIAALADAQLDIRHAPPRAGEIRHSTGVPAAARDMLGLGEPVALRDGLAEVLDWLGTTG